MTDIYQRPLSVEETRILKSNMPSKKEKMKKFLFIYGMASILPLIALLLVLSDQHSFTTNIISIAVFFVMTLAVSYNIYSNVITVTGLDNYINALKNGNVYVWSIKPILVYKRLPAEGVPAAYYLKIHYDNNNHTLFLRGNYINEMEKSGKFPNSSFQIVRTVEGDIVLDTSLLGTPIKPAKTLPPHNFEDYTKGFTPSDNTVLDCDIYEIN